MGGSGPGFPLASGSVVEVAFDYQAGHPLRGFGSNVAA